MVKFNRQQIKFNGSAARLELGKMGGVAFYRIVEVFDGVEVVTNQEPATMQWRQVEDRLMATVREREDAAWLATH